MPHNPQFDNSAAVAPEAGAEPPLREAPPEMYRVEALVEREIGEEAKPGGRNWLVHPPRDLVGLALSGGGIRSATFNLGILETLRDVRMLSRIDYLSTVSGGSYIGGFWTRWRSRQPSGSEKMFPDAGRHLPEAPEIRHLREFSNFLSPRMGLSVDTGRMLVSGLSSAIPSILAAVSVIVLALGAWLGVAGLLFDTSKLLPWSMGPAGAGPEIRAFFALTLITIAYLVGAEARWRWRTSDSAGGAAYLFAAAVGIAVTTAAWFALRGSWEPLLSPYSEDQFLPMPAAGGGDSAWLFLLAPSIAWGAGVLGLVLMRWWYSRWVRGLSWRIVRAAHDRVQMRLLLLSTGWAAISLVWFAGVVLYAWIAGGSSLPRASVVGSAIAIAGALFARLQKVLGKSGESGAVQTVLSRLRTLSPQVLAYLTVALTVVAVAAGLVAVGAAGPATPLARLTATFAAAAVVIVLVLLLLDPNEVALHSFYKSRVIRAYLGASNPATQPKLDAFGRPDPAYKPRTEEHREDDVQLSTVDTGKRPLHLICCAANDQSDSGEMDDLRRGASSAVLSPVGISVGKEGTWAPWTDTNPSMMLGTALTASGAAFNPLMGSHSVRLGPAVTFLAAALNLRLGIWQRHPERMRARDAEAGQGDGASRRQERRTRRPSRKPLLIGLPFFAEMFGQARAEGPYVHLSDGGHFENMGVYELVRRHCRVIVACDCGADPECTFSDVATLVRRARQDFGIEIDIDLDRLRPGEGGLSRSAVALGRIDYPSDERPGVLVLIKPSLVGDEPADISHYRTRSPSFPHETTTDQFYDEAQWESYHRLGRHSAEAALRAIHDGSAPTPAGSPELLATVREWLDPAERPLGRVKIGGLRENEQTVETAGVAGAART